MHPRRSARTGDARVAPTRKTRTGHAAPRKDVVGCRRSPADRPPEPIAHLATGPAERGERPSSGAARGASAAGRNTKKRSLDSESARAYTVKGWALRPGWVARPESVRRGGYSAWNAVCLQNAVPAPAGRPGRSSKPQSAPGARHLRAPGRSGGSRQVEQYT